MDDPIRLARSELNIWFLDDGTFGESVGDVLSDVTVILRELETYGLKTILSTSELTIGKQEAD